MRIGIFHGIDTKPDFKYKHTSEAALGLPKIEVVELRWPSTGTISGDVWELMTSKEYREQCIAEATKNLNNALGRYGVLDVLVGHSMGQVMMIEAVKRVWPDGVGVLPPMLSIGGPMSHPLWGRSLRAVGLGKPHKNWNKIAMGWNSDDIIPAWHGWQTNPAGFDPFRIAIAGQGKNEHPMELYLGHPIVREKIRGLRI